MTQENVKTATLYGKTICPYCKLAKDLLLQNNYEVDYINLDDENARKSFYDRITKELEKNVMSVPQIWISGKYIGGYSNLVKYFEEERNNKEVSFDKDF